MCTLGGFQFFAKKYFSKIRCQNIILNKLTLKVSKKNIKESLLNVALVVHFLELLVTSNEKHKINILYNIIEILK